MRSIRQLEEEIDRIENGMSENLLHSTKENAISHFKNRISEIHMKARCAKFDYQVSRIIRDIIQKRKLQNLVLSMNSETWKILRE